MEYKLDFLDSYDDDSLLRELRRVSALVPGRSLSRKQYDEHGRAHSSTLGKRFGTWEAALRAAGLGHRFFDESSPYERTELLEAVKQAGKEVAPRVLTLNEFTARTGIDGGPVRRCFGSWKGALEEARLTQSALAKRYSDEQCFENLLALWAHYGRAPQHDEANVKPSTVGSKAYVRRWGTWRKALAAFVQRITSEGDLQHVDSGSASPLAPSATNSVATTILDRGPRDVPLALRYFILKRDRFRCVTCGRSPATHPQIHLHVDHIIPWVMGGRTIAENLRSLCNECNLGKGAAPSELP